MFEPIKVSKRDIPASLIPADYQGRKFRVVVAESVHVPADAGLWSGGTRETYTAFNLATGQQADAAFQQSDPWDGARRNTDVALMPGMVIRVHSIFCGSDCGLLFYVHPANAPKFIKRA